MHVELCQAVVFPVHTRQHPNISNISPAVLLFFSPNVTFLDSDLGVRLFCGIKTQTRSRTQLQTAQEEVIVWIYSRRHFRKLSKKLSEKDPWCSITFTFLLPLVLQKRGVGTAASLWKVMKSDADEVFAFFCDFLVLTGVDGSPSAWNGKISSELNYVWVFNSVWSHLCGSRERPSLQ